MEPILVVSVILLWVLGLLNLLLTLGLARRVNAALPRRNPLKVGQSVPDFTAKTLKDETVTFSTYVRRAVAFVFVSPDCQPCRTELPALETLRPKADQVGVDLVVVSDADVTMTQLFVDELGVSLPVLVAPRGSSTFFSDYKVVGTPSYYLVDTQGKIYATGIGLLELEEKLAAFSRRGRANTLRADPQNVRAAETSARDPA